MQVPPQDIPVYIYLKSLIEGKEVKTSQEAEYKLRCKFEHVTMTNSYNYIMRFFRYREKIEALIAAHLETTDPQNVQACETQDYSCAAGGCSSQA